MVVFVQSRGLSRLVEAHYSATANTLIDPPLTILRLSRRPGEIFMFSNCHARSRGSNGQRHSTATSQPYDCDIAILWVLEAEPMLCRFQNQHHDGVKGYLKRTLC